MKLNVDSAGDPDLIDSEGDSLFEAQSARLYIILQGNYDFRLQPLSKTTD